MRVRFVAGMLVIVAFFLWITPVMASDLGGLRLSRLEGAVQLQSQGNEEWYPATGNLPLRSGDRLWVPREAWAQMETRSGSVIRLDAETALEIIEAGDGNSLHAYLSQGQAYFNFLKTRDSMMQVDTPASSVRVYDSSSLNIAIVAGRREREGNAEVSVYRGVALVENREGEIRGSAGKMLETDDGTPFLVGLDSPNGWEEWNRNEDEALLSGGTDNRYLPQELSQYGRDLSRNGHWVSTTEYGNVWTPTTHVTVDWVPYRHGRWVWIGDDFVWVGEEPWGWAPYHYGRWAHVSRYGWCWGPPPRHEVYWGPGFVSWVQTTTTVAWVPLAPRETYYGYGHYGPHSVNIVNVNINNYQHIDGRTCRNALVGGAVTSLERDSFVKGHYRRMKDNDNPFLQEPIHIGRPQIEPHRDVKMPVFKDIPHDQRPPIQVRSYSRLPDDALRTMVKDRRRSVFNPDLTPPPITPAIMDKKGGGHQDLPIIHRQGGTLDPSQIPARRGDGPVLHRQGAPDQKPLVDTKEKEKYPVFGDRSGREKSEEPQRSLPPQGSLYGGSGRFKENRSNQIQPRTMPVAPEPDPAVFQQGAKGEEQGAYPVFKGRPQMGRENELQRSLNKGQPYESREMNSAQPPSSPQPRVYPRSQPSAPLPSMPQRRMQPDTEMIQQLQQQQSLQNRNMEAARQFQQQQAAQEGFQQRNMEAARQLQQQQAGQQAFQNRNAEAARQLQQQKAAQEGFQQRNMEAARQLQQQQAGQQALQQRNVEAARQLQQQQAGQQAAEKQRAEAIKQFQQQQAAQQEAEKQQLQQGGGNSGRGSLHRQGERP